MNSMFQVVFFYVFCQNELVWLGKIHINLSPSSVDVIECYVIFCLNYYIKSIFNDYIYSHWTSQTLYQ